MKYIDTRIIRNFGKNSLLVTFPSIWGMKVGQIVTARVMYMGISTSVSDTDMTDEGGTAPVFRDRPIDVYVTKETLNIGGSVGISLSKSFGFEAGQVVRICICSMEDYNNGQSLAW